MKLMASWMDVDEFLGDNHHWYWKENGQKNKNQICYRQPFGSHFKHCHEVDYRNNAVTFQFQ